MPKDLENIFGPTSASYVRDNRVGRFSEGGAGLQPSLPPPGKPLAL